MGILSLKRDVEEFERLGEIISIIVEHGFHAHMARANLAHHASLRTHIGRFFTFKGEVTPGRVRETFEALGPTFVKMGQVLSLRPDLVPKEYCEEFKKLQDNVPPIPFAAVKGVIEAELHKPLSEVFKEFSKEPIASASIAQVHKATLKDGRDVVVKIQRPGIAEVMRRDIGLMEYIAKRIDTSHRLSFKLTDVVAEFKAYTEHELNFLFEMRNIKRFHDYFAKSEEVVVPAVFEELCSPHVLLMERIDGVPISDKQRLLKEGYSLNTLASIGLRCIFTQVFDFGFFHADPHPGNLIAVRKKRKPAIALIDFGIVGFVDERLREQIINLFIGMADGDAELMTNAILEANERGPECDPEGFRKAVEARLSEWHGSTLGEESATLMLYNIMLDAPKFDVRMSSNSVLMAKAFLTIEGSAIWMNPQMDFVKDMKPLLLEYQRKQLSLKKLRQRALRGARKLETLAEQLPQLAETLATQLKRGKLELHVDAREILEAESVYDLETDRRNQTVMMGALLIGAALLAAFAPSMALLGLSLHWWALIGFFFVLFLYLRTGSKIHKYVRAPGQV